MTTAYPDAALLAAGEDRDALARLLAHHINGRMTAAEAARTAFDILKQVAKAAGQDPKIEVMSRRPGEARFYDDARCWCVAWEAGPHDWAVLASMAITRAAGKLVETWIGFDLMIYPGEWEGAR